jgi:hypothetical protein
MSVKSDSLMMATMVAETCRSKKNYCAVVGNNIKLVYKVVSVHAMKAYRGRRGIVPLILNLDAG